MNARRAPWFSSIKEYIEERPCKSLLFHGGDTGSIPVRDASNFQQLTAALEMVCDNENLALLPRPTTQG
jgi:hypothetical protein